MAVISGVLKGPMGDALEGVVIELRALRTSATVITQERSSSVTNAIGRYSLTVEPGDYSVFISAFGRTPENRGSISVKVNSATGTLNDFLLIPGESDLNPEIVATVDGMRAAAAASEAAAKTSEANAAASANDTVKKSVVTTQSLLGPISITDALSINAKSEIGNANLFFTDSDKSETNAIYSNSTGQMSIRVGKGLYTHQLHTDGFIEPSSGIRLSTRAFSYTDIQGSTGSINFGSNGYLLRGKDIASFDDLNNVNICSWNGIGFVPTTTAGLEANVTQGKPSVIINARTGRVSSKNGFYTDGIINIKTGDYGIGIVNSSGVLDFTKLSTPAGFYRGIEGQTGAPAGASVMAGTSVSVTGSYTGHIYAGHGATPGAIKLYVGWVRSNGTADWVSAWHSGNTTVDSNGFLKKASPIVKLFGSGQCELNEESQGVTTERVGEGVYRVSGTLGFNSDGAWGGANGGIGLPKDVNDLPLIWVDYEVDEFGDLLIKTFHRVNSTAPKFAQNVKAGYKEGQPIDIPAGRWIDLRVEMPGGDEPEYEPVPEDEVPEVTPEVTEPESGEEPAPGETPAPIEEAKE
ncbi:prophage tail fiber N-terminal domain-containing protein [Serratia fonticola]|uniref:phage tail fiber protein n=1 Tax=Serratia fonticola TaxID=47917 RepID=UPI0015C5D4C8|nr:prophage tail fiber N-terminal domain-containing protein [Serratia fonticola]MBC3378505.1 prophage tail fiber N-terminal domain-containing protein [Serratia fonticola]NYA37705.1 prophage tail fiber N-terminal domain-containing protein [Serratia fonticola]